MAVCKHILVFRNPIISLGFTRRFVFRLVFEAFLILLQDQNGGFGGNPRNKLFASDTVSTFPGSIFRSLLIGRGWIIMRLILIIWLLRRRLLDDVFHQLKLIVVVNRLIMLLLLLRRWWKEILLLDYDALLMIWWLFLLQKLPWDLLGGRIWTNLLILVGGQQGLGHDLALAVVAILDHLNRTFLLLREQLLSFAIIKELLFLFGKALYIQGLLLCDEATFDP